MTEAEVAKIFRSIAKLAGVRHAAVMFPWALSAARPGVRAEVLSQLPPPVRLLYRMVWLPRYRRSTPSL